MVCEKFSALFFLSLVVDFSFVVFGLLFVMGAAGDAIATKLRWLRAHTDVGLCVERADEARIVAIYG